MEHVGLSIFKCRQEGVKETEVDRGEGMGATEDGINLKHREKNYRMNTLQTGGMLLVMRKIIFCWD